MKVMRPKPQNNSDLTKRTTGSMVWLVSVRLVSKAVDFLTLLVLAKLLSPQDFGIIAIAMTLVMMIEAIFELPVSQVLVTMPNISRCHLDTAFTLSALRGLVLAMVLWVLAIPFGHFYKDARIGPLIAILSLAPVMRGMASPRMSIFVKRLDFRRELILDFGSRIVSFVFSSCAAWILRDYRALMVGIIATPLALVILSYALAPYRPRLSLQGWPYFSHFLGWTTLSQILSALNWQCDRLLLGRFVTRAELGNYSLANDLSYIPEQALIKPILRPMLSAFSLIGNDTDRLRAAYAKTSSSVLALGLPVMLGLSLLASPAVHFVLGSKWIAAIPALQWLSITLIPPLFTSPFSSLAMAKGRFDAIFRQTITESASKIPFMALGAVMFGMNGAIAARAISAIVTGAFVLYYVKQLTGTSIFRQLFATWRIATSGAVLVAVLLLIRPVLDGQSGIMLGCLLSAVSVAGLAVYIGSMMLLWIMAGRPSGFEQLAFNRALAILKTQGLSRKRQTFGK